VRGLAIYVSLIFMPTDLKGQFPTCATRGANVVAQECVPSIIDTTYHQRITSQTAKLDLASRQCQSPSPIYRLQCISNLSNVILLPSPLQHTLLHKIRTYIMLHIRREKTRALLTTPSTTTPRYHPSVREPGSKQFSVIRYG
jgi:hypothetical protein